MLTWNCVPFLSQRSKFSGVKVMFSDGYFNLLLSSFIPGMCFNPDLILTDSVANFRAIFQNILSL